MSNDYIRWLIDDQAKGLLNMTYEQIAKKMGISRQSLAKYQLNNTYTAISVEGVNRLYKHIDFVKAALLTTEAKEQ